MALKIVTDSASDTPVWIIEEFGLHVIPTPVVIEEKDYFDGKTIFPEEFYSILQSGKDIKTYHINAQMFMIISCPMLRITMSIYICFSTESQGLTMLNIAKTELLRNTLILI